jgi:ferrochelatase
VDDDTALPYDALLVVSFGGPEGPDDVLPFLENVTKGHDVPPARLAAVAAQYERFGGVSPINGHTRRLVTALVDKLGTDGPDLRVYWGNRNWHPLLADVVAEMADDGVRRALAFVTSAFSSYSGCRQYLNDIALARAVVGPRAPEIDKLRVFFNHPGYIVPLAARTVASLNSLPVELRDEAVLVFTAHSIPVDMAGASDYETQLRDAAGLVAERVDDGRPWVLAFQSRSGRPTQPWLEPDVGDVLDRLALEGTRAVVVVPVGFVSDHMEVVYDLDVVARGRAETAGLTMRRVSTAGDDPAFVEMIRELALERIAPDTVVPRSLGALGVHGHACPAGCCRG